MTPPHRCQQKKVQLFGALVTETILFPVPHRHFTFGIPKMLRPYFRFNRALLKDYCRIAHESLLAYMQTALNLPDGLPGIVMKKRAGWSPQAADGRLSL